MSWKDRFAKWITALKKLMWPLITMGVAVALIIFFISYSLARHKKLVGELKSQVILLKAEKKVQQVETEKVKAKLKIAQLNKDDLQNEKKRKELLNVIKEKEKSLVDAQKDLDKKRKNIPRKNLDQLIKRSNQLMKDTL